MIFKNISPLIEFMPVLFWDFQRIKSECMLLKQIEEIILNDFKISKHFTSIFEQ